MIKNLYLSLLLLFPLLTWGQIITITDKQNNLPIELVSLSSQEPKAFVLSDANGQADISNFKGSKRIEIRLLGYKTLHYSFAELQQKAFKVSMSISKLSLDEMVVSATRWEQSKKDIPNKISSIKAKDVALQNPQTAADLLSVSGEVFVQKSQQGGGSPMIRGFASNRLLYTVDGVRMNTAIFRGGNIQNVISLDPFAIENTEVFFGPGSIIYGSDAIGGVMSFRTIKPQFSESEKMTVGGSAATRYSTANDEKTGHLDIRLGWKKWASVTSISYNDYGDLRMGTHGPDDYLRPFFVERIDGADQIIQNDNPKVQRPTGFQQMNVMQKIRFKPSEKWDFQYGFHYSETSDFARYDRLIETNQNGVPRSAVWNYGPQKWMMNNLNIEHIANKKLYDEINIRLAHQQFEESRINRNFSGGNRFRLRTQTEIVDAYSINVDFKKQLEKHVIMYGLEGIRNDVNSVGEAIDIRDNSDIPTASRYPNSTWNSYAAFLNYQNLISEKFTFQTGLRYAHYQIQSDFSNHLAFYPFDFTSSEINNGALTGSIGLVYHPDDTWMISMNASTGFRAPNVDDVGKIFDFQAESTVVPNTNLKAEYAYNGEINIAKIFADVVKVDISAFYTLLDNALVRRTFQVNGQDSILFNGEMSQVFAIQNAAKANVYGMNAGIEIKLPFQLTLMSKFNYQLGEEEMDDGSISRSRHAAPWFGVTRLSYNHKKLNLQFYSMYSGEISYDDLNEEERQKPFIYTQDENGNPYSPSWFTINFKANYELNKFLMAGIGLENITDQRYRPYSSGLTAAGRNLIVSLRADF